jgi:quercetin dioxygenase-like cupin family protein
MLKGDKMQLNKMIDYQKGAVVSRTIVKKNTGTVTLFSFAKGQGLSEHTAPFEALVYLVDGEAEITIAGKPQKAVTGDLVVLPANRPHALKAVKKFKMMLIMIKSSK